MVNFTWHWSPHSQGHTSFFFSVHGKMFVFHKLQYSSHTVHWCSTSIHSLSECSCISSQFFKDPLPKSPVCSDWSALTGQSRHRQVHFHINTIGVFTTTAVLETWFRVLTSQCHGVFSLSFVQIFVGVFWCFHSIYLASTPAAWSIKK